MEQGSARPRPLVLVVLDGFGIGRDPAADAIAAARMPAWRELLATWPHARLRGLRGPRSGCPVGQMGNSEVGHLNLGAGRPVLQDLPRVDAAIADGSFFTNPALAPRRGAREPRTARRLHLVGLVGPGGVHSNDRQAVAIAQLAQQHGRRGPRRPRAARRARHPAALGRGVPAGPGRPPGRGACRRPDRDDRGALLRHGPRPRWERIARYYDAMVHGVGRHAPTADIALAVAYERGENDEFVEPTVIDAVDGRVRDGDVVIHFNFRADRARRADPRARRRRRVRRASTAAPGRATCWWSRSPSTRRACPWRSPSRPWS